ncbi:MAG: phosphatase PAP2 family protein [Clostridiales bacterium]|nr:phosphatase PAP2 family protein [Clostridiales bacterium]
MFDLALIETIQSYRQPLLDAIMIAFSTLGGDLAYMAAIPLLYWLVSREKAYRLAVVFIWAVWLNVALKEWVGSSRPEMFPQVVALLPAGGPGFPSGHAQASIAFWGWLMVEFRKPWLYLLGTLMILGISFSRLYVGAHFLGEDVLGSPAVAFRGFAITFIHAEPVPV